MHAASHPGMPPGPIAGPSAWYGRDLARDSAWLYHFHDAELAEIDAAVHAFADSGEPLASIGPGQFVLPRLGPRLQHILHDLLDGRGFVLMRGFEPARYTRFEQAIAYMGIGTHFGTPRSQNAKGHLLGHVKDLGLDIKDPGVRYYQTNRKLEFHTDSCDIVGLLCLQTARFGGESFIASSTTVYNEIFARRPDLVSALFENFPTDRRGEIPDGMLPWFDIPICNWFEARLSCIYVRQYIESAQHLFPHAARLGTAQIEAMNLIDELVNDPAIHLSMSFLPGDMQFLHNHQILHSRNDFENWPDPAQHRHLLRLWLAPAAGRPLPDVFSPRYGSIVPGERGGIVLRDTALKVPLVEE